MINESRFRQTQQIHTLITLAGMIGIDDSSFVFNDSFIQSLSNLITLACFAYIISCNFMWKLTISGLLWSILFVFRLLLLYIFLFAVIFDVSQTLLRFYQPKYFVSIISTVFSTSYVVYIVLYFSSSLCRRSGKLVELGIKIRSRRTENRLAQMEYH